MTNWHATLIALAFLAAAAALPADVERELRASAVLVRHVAALATSTIGRDGATLADAAAMSAAAWIDRIVVVELEVEAVEV